MKNTDLLELHIRCDVTKKTAKLVGPYISRDKIIEEKEMYQRHALLSTTLIILPRDVTTNPLNWIEKMNIDKKEHNPFDSKFKPTSKVVIPKDPNDPRDLPWLLTFDSLKEEKSWVESCLDSVVQKIYKENPDILPNANLVGSFWHRGFVNVLFDRDHCSHMQTVRKWIDLIGNIYDPNIITNLGVPAHDGLYVNNFFTDDVKRLCEYCHQIFGVDKYEVAKLFTTKNPDEFDINSKDIATRAYNLTQVAAVYAERSDVESARKYYQNAITVLQGKNWQCNFINKYEKFEKYVLEHGTSVLSSNF